MVFILKKEDMPRFVEYLSRDFRVFGPIRKDEEFIFSEILAFEDLALDYVTTLLPPKKYFLPPFEVLFSFKKNGGFSIKEARPEDKCLLFAVHPCDVNAILLLDNVFSKDYEDPYYFDRRRHTVIVGLNCTEVGDHCFCTSFDTGPSLREGYDVLLTDIVDSYLVEVGTDIGKRIVQGFKLETATAEDVKRKDERLEKSRRKIRKRIDTDGLPELLAKEFGHEIWSELKEECLACGSCTIVCPTCYCYNVIDKVDLSLRRGERIRVWDSCLLLEFAEVALGGNFRRDRDARIKQFMYHKLSYFKQQYGSFGCVGCGRCIKTCVKEIDLTEVIQKIRGG